MTNVEVQLEASTRNAEIEDYLGQLDSALSGIAFEQKRDILSEIRAHVVDSAAVRGGDVGGAHWDRPKTWRSAIGPKLFLLKLRTATRPGYFCKPLGGGRLQV